MEHLPAQTRLGIDQEFQAHWYKHLSTLVEGKTVLDAGAGVGYGLDILRGTAAEVEGFDLVSVTAAVKVGKIESYPTGSWDWVTALDVIEHVEADEEFLLHMLRVAREGVFFSTPNWNVSKAVNQFHVREYTPVELRDLIARMGFTEPWQDHQIWVSNHELVITTRDEFNPEETWHNQAVALLKRTA